VRARQQMPFNFTRFRRRQFTVNQRRNPFRKSAVHIRVP
jgi:hypothetical protein